jgi:hypothetical protein
VLADSRRGDCHPVTDDVSLPSIVAVTPTSHRLTRRVMAAIKALKTTETNRWKD